MPTNMQTCPKCGDFYNGEDSHDVTAHAACREIPHSSVVTGNFIPVTIVGVRDAAGALRAGALVGRRVVVKSDAVFTPTELRRLAKRVERMPFRLYYAGKLVDGNLVGTVYAMTGRMPTALGTAVRLAADFQFGADDLADECADHFTEVLAGKARDAGERAIELLLGEG